MNRTYNGSTFYLRDDCDTLICKLENKINDLEFNPGCDKCKLDKYYEDLDDLERAFVENDIKEMNRLMNEYHQWFKRYR